MNQTHPVFDEYRRMLSPDHPQPGTAICAMVLYRTVRRDNRHRERFGDGLTMALEPKTDGHSDMSMDRDPRPALE